MLNLFKKLKDISMESNEKPSFVINVESNMIVLVDKTRKDNIMTFTKDGGGLRVLIKNIKRKLENYIVIK